MKACSIRTALVRIITVSFSFTAALDDASLATFGFEAANWSGIELSSVQKKQGKTSGLWKEHEKNKSIGTEKFVHDWSGFSEMRLWIYSEKNTGETMIIILNSRTDPKVFSYFSAQIVVNWQGWKEVKLPFRKFGVSRDPAGWQQIDSISITVDGWGLKPHPESTLYMDDMRLIPGEAPDMKAEKKSTPMPDMKRVKEIAAMLPEKPEAVLVPPIRDRASWQSIDAEQAKKFVDSGERQLKNGLPPWNDDDYLAYSKQGKRIGDSMTGRRAGHLRDLLIAECIEDKGRFISTIEAAVEGLASDPSWTLAAHDGKLNNYYGKRFEVDLNAAARALLFTGVYRMLGERLSPKTRETIVSELHRRVLDQYRTRLVSGTDRDGFWWMVGNNNWNAVCHAGVVLSALAVVESAEERALFIHGAEIGLPFFLNGMTDDGYCTEGIGYWGYGFGNYVLLSAGIHIATKGKVDWFNNAKVAAIGRFGKRMELAGELYPAYADCGPNAKPSGWIMYLMDRLYEPGAMSAWQTRGTPYAVGDPQSIALTFMPRSMYYTAKPYPQFVPKAGESIRDFFEEAGILNCRPMDETSPDAIAVSFKGGHNAEEHNHNDLGSFVIAAAGAKMPLIVDPGNEVYTARTFSSRRYESRALSSFGHSVPVIDGKFQRPGRDAEAKIVETAFTDASDRFIIDITSAYDEVEGVTGLKRTFVFHRSPAVSASVSDTFTAERAMSFGTAVLTYDKWMKTAPDTILIYSGKQALEVKVNAGSEKFTFRESIIDEDMGYKLSKPVRIGIDLEQPVKSAVVTLRIRRVNPSDYALPGKIDNEARADNLGVFTPERSKAVTVQAEDIASESGGTVAVGQKVGDSGASIKLWDAPGHTLSWKFIAPEAGEYGIALRYCAADPTVRTVSIDGKPIGPETNAFQFFETGGWSSDTDNWKNVWLAAKMSGLRVKLAAGEHTITMVSGGGGLNLDWIRIVPATGKDILNANPNFDDADNDGTPDGWLLSPAPNGTATKTARVQMDGKAAMHIVDNDTKNGVGLQQLIPVKPGRWYRERAVLKGSPIALYFVWYDADKKQIGKEVTKRIEPGSGFTPAEHSAEAPAGAVTCKAWIYSWSSNTGETFIESFEFEDVGAAAPK
ncbi:MAG: heparinase II/III family protein [Spirochaetota bacterium]